MLKKLNDATVLQAVKTGVAETAAFYLSGLFHLPQGYWATMSAFIVLQGDLYQLPDTRSAGRSPAKLGFPLAKLR